MLINVNFPDLLADEVRGVRVTTQGKRKIGDTLVERIDPRGEPYLWIGALREERRTRRGHRLARRSPRATSRSRRSTST